MATQEVICTVTLRRRMVIGSPRWAPAGSTEKGPCARWTPEPSILTAPVLAAFSAPGALAGSHKRMNEMAYLGNTREVQPTLKLGGSPTSRSRLPVLICASA